MNRDLILTELIEIITDVADLKPQEITADSALKDELDVDSLGMVEIVVFMEDRFELKLPEDRLADVVTVGDLMDVVAQELEGRELEGRPPAVGVGG